MTYRGFSDSYLAILPYLLDHLRPRLGDAVNVRLAVAENFGLAGSKVSLAEQFLDTVGDLTKEPGDSRSILGALLRDLALYRLIGKHRLTDLGKHLVNGIRPVCASAFLLRDTALVVLVHLILNESIEELHIGIGLSGTAYPVCRIRVEPAQVACVDLIDLFRDNLLIGCVCACSIVLEPMRKLVTDNIGNIMRAIQGYLYGIRARVIASVRCLPYCRFAVRERVHNANIRSGNIRDCTSDTDRRLASVAHEAGVALLQPYFNASLLRGKLLRLEVLADI